jgi:hypothetical protein
MASIDPSSSAAWLRLSGAAALITMWRHGLDSLKTAGLSNPKASPN